MIHENLDCGHDILWAYPGFQRQSELPPNLLLESTGLSNWRAEYIGLDTYYAVPLTSSGRPSLSRVTGQKPHFTFHMYSAPSSLSPPLAERGGMFRLIPFKLPLSLTITCKRRSSRGSMVLAPPKRLLPARESSIILSLFSATETVQRKMGLELCA